MAGEAAKRYAQAALELAVEGGNVAQWRSDLEDIAQVFSDSQVADYFSNSKVPLDDRVKAVERVLELAPLPLNFARVLVTRGRSRDARAIERAFTRMADAHEGIELAVITTAVPLEPEQQQRIERELSAAIGKRIRSSTTVDPSVVGGIVVRVGDKLIDGSIRTRLRRLRRELEGAR